MVFSISIINVEYENDLFYTSQAVIVTKKYNIILQMEST